MLDHPLGDSAHLAFYRAQQSPGLGMGTREGAAAGGQKEPRRPRAVSWLGCTTSSHLSWHSAPRPLRGGFFRGP
jgi:hypothetical protein